jgi:hypothetical protein
LRLLDLNAETEGISARLQSLCKNCGVFFEKRLEEALAPAVSEGEPAATELLSTNPLLRDILTQDLKARLAMIKQFVGHLGFGQLFPATAEVSAFASAVDLLLDDIIHQQKEIVRRRDASDSFQVFHFLLTLTDITGRARLKIGFPRPHATRSRDGFRAALLLEFDRLGETRIDLFLADRNLDVTFCVKAAPMKLILEEHMYEIRAALVPFFEHVQVKVSVSEKKITEFESEDLQAAGARRVDVRA